MAARNQQIVTTYSGVERRAELTTSQVDQVSHADLVSQGNISELAADRDESLILEASEALVGEHDGTVAAASREAVMERQADGLASVVGAEAIFVDEVVLKLPCDVVPDLWALGLVSGLRCANDPGGQEERDESTFCKHLRRIDRQVGNFTNAQEQEKSQDLEV